MFQINAQQTRTCTFSMSSSTYILGQRTAVVYLHFLNEFLYGGGILAHIVEMFKMF